MISWLKEKMWIKEKLADKLQIDTDKILFSEHHLSHAASTFLCSPFEEAAIVTVDGVGEWATVNIGIGHGNDVKILKEMRFPHSIGLLYSAFTAFLGFEINEGEYKVMGMAPYGQPRHVDKVLKTININNDGSFSLNPEYFTFHYSEKESFSKTFERVFGKPQDSKKTDYINPHYADIAASIQRVTEETMLKIVEYAHKLTGMENLCMAGGVALNSKVNGRIMKEGPFKRIFIQPASGDSGCSFGAALLVYNTLLQKPRKYIMENAYLGQGYKKEEVKSFLERYDIDYEYIGSEKSLVDSIAKEIKSGKVIGWSQGKFEWGPRALGHRSILADPRTARMKNIVNLKIKFREPFRPFAPSVIVDSTENYFELENAESHYPARFMLFVVPVKEEKQKRIPAVTHVDGTARPQTIHKKESPLYYKLVERFGELTGVDAVLNTSFNLKGEPIVNSPFDAFKTFSRSGLDVLVLDNFVITK